MSYNGSGTFLINSAGQPVVANTVISATVFNALTSDLATGLSTAITKDGQTTITANIPFGSNKITGLGSGTAATDAANLGQVQSTAAKLVTVTGTDTITGSMSPQLTAYAAGQLFYFVAAGANTGAVTINIDGLGAKSVTRDGNTALANGDINSGEVVVLVYDGTRFQMINAANSFGNTTINGTLTVTGNTGLQANVSITSALSVGGTFNVTGAAALGSTLAVTGKSDLPTVSTASMNAAVALITTGTVTNLTSTSASVASINAAVALITTGTVTALTATGASVASANVGTAVVTGLTVTNASIASLNAGTATITTGNLTFSSTAQRITGDFSNATLSNRPSFQTSTTNGNTTVHVLPNGTATFTAFRAFNNSDPTNAAFIEIQANATETRLNSNVSGTGTALPLTFFCAGAERMRLDTSGNLGIGLTPTYKFEVLSSSSDVARFTVLNKTIDGTGNLQVFTSTNQAADVGGSIALGGKNGSGGAFDPWAFGVIKGAKENSTSSNLAGYLAFATANSGGTVSERMRIDSSGNVGIATGNLTFSGTSQRITGDMSNATLSNRLFFQTSTTNGATSVGSLPNGTGTQGNFLAWNNSDLTNAAWLGILATSTEARIQTNITGTGTALPMTFNVNGSERMRLTTAGDLGLGTTSPSGKLQVTAANTRVRFSNTAGTTSTLLFGADSGETFLGTETNGPIYFITNNTERMRITAAGNISAGAGALATTATDGFLYVPTCAGTPTGTPTAITGMAPIVVDTTNNKLYFYSTGVWRDAGP